VIPASRVELDSIVVIPYLLASEVRVGRLVELTKSCNHVVGVDFPSLVSLLNFDFPLLYVFLPFSCKNFSLKLSVFA